MGRAGRGDVLSVEVLPLWPCAFNGVGVDRGGKAAVTRGRTVIDRADLVLVAQGALVMFGAMALVLFAGLLVRLFLWAAFGGGF